MKKLLTVFTLLMAIALAAFTMTACLGGDNLPNNSKGQVMNQPSSAPSGGNTAPTAPAEGGAAAPPAGGDKAAPPADTGGEDDAMPGGGE